MYQTLLNAEHAQLTEPSQQHYEASVSTDLETKAEDNLVTCSKAQS